MTEGVNQRRKRTFANTPVGPARPKADRAARSAGPKARKKNLRIKNWIFEFSKALEICRRRFRRNFDMGIFSKFFQAPQGFQKNIICHAMQCILYMIYFWKGFSYALQFDMHFICTPILTKFYSCKNVGVTTQHLEQITLDPIKQVDCIQTWLLPNSLLPSEQN